jgi:hypothetical protein
MLLTALPNLLLASPACTGSDELMSLLSDGVENISFNVHFLGFHKW